MSNEKRKKFSHGGARTNSGPKKGSGEKTKICVSVSKQTWQVALRSWTGKASHLVNMLVSDHVKRNASDQKLDAIT